MSLGDNKTGIAMVMVMLIYTLGVRVLPLIKKTTNGDGTEQ